MTITIAAYEDSATVGTTERSIPNASTSLSPITAAGIYQAFIDLNALAAGDIFQFTAYETVASSGGTQRIIYTATFSHVQGTKIWVSPTLVLGVGWDMTVKKLSGTDRAIVSRIAEVA
jgi:hypothetical protein